MTAPEQPTGADGGLSLGLTSGIMVSVIMLLLAFFLLVFFLYLRQKHYWGTIPAFGRPVIARADSAAESASGVPRGGLDATTIEALPSFVYRQGAAAEAIECSVCITELADGEASRQLPKCGHAFHLECVDMWLRAHSTCPVCRCAVVFAPPENGETVSEVSVRPLAAAAAAAAAVSGVGSAAEGAARARTGDSSSQGVSTAEEMVVIEIPRGMAEGLPSPALSPLPLSGSAAAEEVRSPSAARLRALRGFLISGKWPEFGR